MQLETECYNCMFRNCDNLVYGPSILPATTLATYCYSGMFYECDNFEHAPVLPNATVPSGQVKCYQVLFSGCRKLNYIEVYFTSWVNSEMFNDWVASVASAGTFKCPSTLPNNRGIDYIPTNWTRVDAT